MNEQNLNNIENENEPQELENEQVINETEAQDDFQFLGDPTQNKEKKEKPVSKLRHFMPLIVLGICAVLLISAVFVLQKFNKDDITEENPEDKKTIQLFDFTGTTATRLEIKNQLDSYAFVRKLEKTYYIENYQDCPVDNATVLSILTQFGSLEAVTEVAKDVTDFSQYQLDKPVSTVTWIKGDKKHTLEIGMVAASGNYYARVDGTNTVYTISSEVATLFVSPRMDFYNTHIYDFDKDTDANYINYFEIERKGEETIKIELSDLSQEDIDSAYVMVAPIKHNLSINKSNEFTDIVGNLSDCTVYSDDVSEKSLKEFGLTDPAITFTFVNVAEKHTFRISEPTDKGYSYMYHE